MDNLMAGRLQMATSLGFHIVFACIGMVMPFLMAAAHWRYLRTGEERYKTLAKAWSKGVAIFFATGAVSGTMLSFELGTLWPEFMRHAGAIIGMPFSLEGTAFFIEAIALGVFLYGWERVPRWVHFGSGVLVGIMGVLSGILVVAANAWMNSPTGLDWVDGQATNIDPVAAMFNAAWFNQSLHMTLAAFVATGFAVAGIHAWQLRRRPGSAFHLSAMKIALAIGGVAAILQPLSGDLSAKDVARRQPAKLAAMEALYETETGAHLLIGGIPDPETKTVSYAIRIPYALSFLAHGDFQAEVTGLDAIPDDEEPPVPIVHYAFQLMVGFGMALMGLALLFFFFRWRRPAALQDRRFLLAVALATPLGMLAVEAGWVVTEVGRQPWIIQGIMRTSEAITPMPGLAISFYLTTAMYIALSFIVYWLMTRQLQVINRAYDGQLTTA
ncbi:MAG: cytochrome ubiquinol oxidase subunit I [Bacteroidetes bacterium]|nr:MAG: cytochrome ubiquinol oxidase subunit I [Bacteroidota bacterium]